MKVTVIPIIDDGLGIVLSSLEKSLEEWEIRERIETIQMIALFRLARILKGVLES